MKYYLLMLCFFVIVVLTGLSACNGSSGSNRDTPSNNGTWDNLIWDKDNWQ